MTRAMHYVPVGLSGNDQQCHVVNTSLARTLYHTTKILDSSKFKANAGNKLRITQIIKFTYNSLPNDEILGLYKLVKNLQKKTRTLYHTTKILDSSKFKANG